MATSTVLEVDTTQSLLCLIPRLIMLDNTYYFLYAPETRIKKTRESTYSKPKTGTRFYLNRATAKENAAKILYESCLQKKINFQADAMPMTHMGQVCEMPTDEA